MKRRLPATACHAITVQGSGSKPDKGSSSLEPMTRAKTLISSLPPGRAAKRKKTKIGGTYLLRGPPGRSKPHLLLHGV